MVISSVVLFTILALGLSISLQKIDTKLETMISVNSPALLPWPVPDEVEGVGDEVPQEEENTDQTNHEAHGSPFTGTPQTSSFLCQFSSSLSFSHHLSERRNATGDCQRSS